MRSSKLFNDLDCMRPNSEIRSDGNITSCLTHIRFRISQIRIDRTPDGSSIVIVTFEGLQKPKPLRWKNAQ